MKIKKFLCVLCVLSLVFVLTACDGMSTLRLDGKRCDIGTGAKVSQLPEPYCSLNQEQEVMGGAVSEASSGLDAEPFYKIWVANNQDQPCLFKDTEVTGFLMVGGAPDDMVYFGVTFGQTEEEVDSKIQAREKEDVEVNDSIAWDTVRTIFFQTLGEDWESSVKMVRYRESLGYYFYVLFYQEKVHAMMLIQDTLLMM